MKLDLTFNGKIDLQNARLFNQIAVDIQHPFNELINSVSRKHAKNIDWWVSSPASRNTFASPLFHYCCCLALLQELIRKKEPISEIITDSKAFKEFLKNYLEAEGKDLKITFARLPMKQWLKERIRPIYVIFSNILLFLFARLTRPLRKPLPPRALTLIDTFVMQGYIEKDRNYPGVLDALSEKEKECVWFVPHLYGFRPWQFLRVIEQLRRSGRNFLLKDDFLKFRDYWHPWRYFFQIRKLEIKTSFFHGADISPLVREELTGLRNVNCSYVPLLNYRFSRRLRQAGVKLKLIVDWFENQSMGKGWNAGFRRFFPRTEIKGYQGFLTTPHYLCMFPTEVEKESKVIPHEISVIGRGQVQSSRKFAPSLAVKVVPAFRFQSVWRERKYLPVANEYTILITLPVMLSEAAAILKLLALTTKNQKVDVRFWIKPHPATSEAQIKGTFGEAWPEWFEFVNGDFNEYVEKSNLLISGVSSTCMETLAKGIPVVVIGNNDGLTHNPIPKSITGDIWRLCYSPAEVEDAVKFYKTRSPEKIKEHEEAGKKIREEYFEPVTRDGIRRFLRLDNSKVS